MQEYGGGKSGEYRDGSDGRDRGQEGYHSQQYSVIPKSYGCANKDTCEQSVTSYCRVATSYYEGANAQYQNTRYNNQSAPTFSSPPNSPLVGLVFDPTSPNYTGPSAMADRLNPDRRSISSWSVSHQEPIGTGAKKKIVKSHDKRNAYSADPRYNEKYKDTSNETERLRKQDRRLNSESTSSLDFYVEGEKMVSELCNIPDLHSHNNSNNQKLNQKGNNQEDDRNKQSGSSDILLTALDKIVIHDQIPNQIVQLAIEACTDAENIAIAHHNRPCFKNIHSICAKTRSNVQKPDSAVANLHSQGIPWVIKNFIFSFVRILDGWKGVKELLSEKHDTFSRIENKYYSQNIRECFVQWQAVTKEMLTHIYKTFKCLDHGFTLEQKSFTHNYYATNSAAPRHQNQSKFQSNKPHPSNPRPVNASPQPYNVLQPPWIQSQSSSGSQSFNESPWPTRTGVSYKKFPVVASPTSHNFYSLNDQSDLENYQKSQYKCDPCSIREAKPRQSWTITNVTDFRTLEGMYQADQRELYTQLKHKMDAELGKAPGQPILNNISCDMLQRRDMELKAKMIPLSHVEKTLIPSMASTAEMRSCYMQKNNSCGDTKEEADFFAAWGQMIQKEPNDYLTHHTHNIQVPSNVVTISNNISGPVQFIDHEHDEFHEMSKVYMKPGSYKVPIKPTDTMSSFLQNVTQEVAYDNSSDDLSSLKGKVPFPPVVLAPQPKYNIESWPCLMSRRAEEIYAEDTKANSRTAGIPCLDIRTVESLDMLSSVTSDRAWEAAKQSAPKLMDFIHEGSKSDTARLYDALGLSGSDECLESFKHAAFDLEHGNNWPAGLSSNGFMSKQMPKVWNENSLKTDTNIKDHSMFTEELSNILTEELKRYENEDRADVLECKHEQLKEINRCPNFDQSGNCVRDESQRKTTGKSRVAVSGMWYHPKKKKPLPAITVKKFESIIATLSQIEEAAFIVHDMDMKVAPRFYEVVKYPMCLHDISTKLNNSSYTENDQVIQDFRRIFNNIRLYLKSHPDSFMKKNLNKVSTEFEKILNEEFSNKCDTKTKSYDNTDEKDSGPTKKKSDKNYVYKGEDKNDDSTRKNDSKQSGDDKK